MRFSRDGAVKSTHITGKTFAGVKRAFRNHLDSSANLMTRADNILSGVIGKPLTYQTTGEKGALV